MNTQTITKDSIAFSNNRNSAYFIPNERIEIMVDGIIYNMEVYNFIDALRPVLRRLGEQDTEALKQAHAEKKAEIMKVLEGLRVDQAKLMLESIIRGFPTHSIVRAKNT